MAVDMSCRRSPEWRLLRTGRNVVVLVLARTFYVNIMGRRGSPAWRPLRTGRNTMVLALARTGTTLGWGAQVAVDISCHESPA